MSTLWYPELAAELARQDKVRTEFAAELDLNPQAISQIVRGRFQPSEGLRQRIAAALGRPESELFAVNPAITALLDARRAQGFDDRVTDPDVLRQISLVATSTH